MNVDLSLIWALIIIVGVMIYVILDGFDLGVGIMYPFVSDKHDRDLMMNSVAPVWDGNETWLVLGGAALFGAFPLVYSVVLSALYVPLMIMLAGLIFRGVAFEFRFKSGPKHRHLWDKAFIGGSTLATFCQGMALGAFVEGLPVVDRVYAGGPLDWLTPFSIFCGAGLVVTYALFGCTWLIMKAPDPLQQRMRAVCYPLATVMLVVMAVLSLWIALTHDAIAERWFTLPNLFWFLPVPVLVLAAYLLLLRSVRQGGHICPFLLSLALFLLGYFGLCVSLWPLAIPPAITIWDASSPHESQIFMLIGTLAILPVVLGYTAWSYYVFRGKVSHDDGYHH